MLERLLNTRKETEDLCKYLLPEDSVVQPTLDVSPPKWHLAHSTWFFETFILKKYYLEYQEYHADFNYLFNSYYDTIGERVPRNLRGTITRPTLSEVFLYRKYVNESLNKFLSQNEISAGLSDLLELGIQHEQQHQELLLTDIKYILGNNPVYPAYASHFFTVDNSKDKTIHTESEVLTVHEGVYEIGFQGKGFCFDNELGRHKVYIHSFEAESNLVKNKEYLDFILDGGYSNFNLWLSEGWEWIKANKITCPLYWMLKDKEWKVYDFSGLIDLPMNATLCHINFYEADAFARWKGKRLLSEFEWEIASPRLNTGIRWEWTNSAYLPYPYYARPEGAIGEYNSKFMINQMVLRGGSIASPQGHVRPTYRNFFPPEKQWQFTGIRLCKSL